tara:strand:- start:139 stop:801 length:663 start_codon:yes stop_codon:yes gene_type:complete
MDCQKLVVYAIILVVGIYVLKDVCGVKLPFIEGFDAPVEGAGGAGGAGQVVEPMEDAPVQTGQAVPETNEPVIEPYASLPAGVGSPSDLSEGGVGPAEPGSNSFHLPIQGIQTASGGCDPQNTLGPADLLPEGEADQIQTFNKDVPEGGEGILKGVNFLDAGFHVGVNTIGQSLRNANLNLRAEPPNPRTQVSPWLNSTIDQDLARRPLGDGLCGPGVEA